MRTSASRPLRLGLACPPFSGHLNPTLALGSELRTRGHDVAYFGLRDAQGPVEAAGLEFILIGERDMPAGTVPGWTARQGELSGMPGCRWLTNCLLQEGVVQTREMGDALRAWHADGLLADQVSYGAPTAADSIGLPYVTLCNSLPMHLDFSSPPPFSTSGPWQGPGRRLRNLGLWAPAMPLVAPVVRALNRERATQGLTPYTWRNVAESRLAVVAQLPAAFEFPGRRPLPRFHNTGPWVRADARQPTPFPWERLDGRPLIYASMGTLQNGVGRVFETIAAACAGLDAQLVVALGHRAARLDASIPANATVVPFAPQLALIDRASLVITHAGLNTALEALSRGVPMVAIPITADQPGVAARIRHCGAGEFVTLRGLSVERLRMLVARVLGEPSYALAARRLRDHISKADGLRRAADVIEETILRAEAG